MEYNEARREYLVNEIESIACTYEEAWSNDKCCYSLPLALPDTHSVCLVVRKLRPEASLPRHGTDGAAGYDLASSEDTTIPANGKAQIGNF